MQVFVDTGVWYAAHVPREPNCRACRVALGDSSAKFLTTDYVLDEVVTLLNSRGLHRTAVRVGDLLWSQSEATLHRLTDDELQYAWSIFRRFSDKRWSFTDCTSYAVMQRLGVTEALSPDDHFRQFGFVSVRP